MKKLFVGFLFAFVSIGWTLDFNPLFSQGEYMHIELLPDFIGYILLFFGALTLKHKNIWFKRAMRLLPIAILFSILYTVACLAGMPIYFIDENTGGFSSLYLLYLAGTVICMTAAGLIIKGITVMQIDDGVDYNAVSLRHTAIAAIALHILREMPLQIPNDILFFLLQGGTLVSAGALLFQMFFAMRMYNDAQTAPADTEA